MKPTKLLDYEQEYIKYKKNNRQLSKALAEQQQLNKRYSDENNVLQKKLYISSTLNMQYEKRLNDLLKYLKQSLNGCIELTNIISPTLVLCKEGIDLQKTLDIDNEKFDQYKQSNSPGNSHRMQAVKPMVSGHVIHHPTINLSRINQPFVANATAVQTLNSNSNTNTVLNEPISNNTNITNSNNHLVDDYQFNLDETDESEEEALVTTEEPEPEVQTTRSLDTILEFNEESTPETPNSSITRELRIVIEPLNSNSFTSSNTPIPKAQPKSRRLDDPLEGTSSMLDPTGHVTDFNNYVPKPRIASKKTFPELDSDSEDGEIDKRNRSKWVGKRKIPTEKKDVTGQKYKVKRNRSNGTGNNISPNDHENNIEDHLNMSNNTADEPRYSSERLSRRNTAKSLAEPSLKKKLRR